MLLRLEGQTGVTVCGEDLLNGVDIGSGSQIQAQVVFHGCLHDGTSRTLHGVIQAGVYDVLLGGARDALLERLRGCDGNATADTSKTTLQRFLNGFCNMSVLRAWQKPKVRERERQGRKRERDIQSD